MTAQNTLRTWNCLVFEEVLFIPYWDAGTLLILLLVSACYDFREIPAASLCFLYWKVLEIYQSHSWFTYMLH